MPSSTSSVMPAPLPPGPLLGATRVQAETYVEACGQLAANRRWNRGGMRPVQPRWRGRRNAQADHDAAAGGWPRGRGHRRRWGWPPAAARPAAVPGRRPRPGRGTPGDAAHGRCAALRRDCEGRSGRDAAHRRQPVEILPRAMTITAAPRAAALAAALCALPRMPRGLRCPAALGGALRLEFTAGGRRYHAGSHPGLGLCQRHRGGPGPAVGLVIAARAAAERGGRRLRPAGGRDASEQRAHAVIRSRAGCPSRHGPRRRTPLPPRSVPLSYLSG